jgi:hypothetical protein
MPLTIRPTTALPAHIMGGRVRRTAVDGERRSCMGAGELLGCCEKAEFNAFLSIRLAPC